MADSDLTVKDNKAKHRFEMDLDGETAFIDYIERGDTIVMTHTEVPPAFEGKGVGSKLVKGALDSVKESGKQINPMCSFVAAYIKRHQEYQSLVAQTF